MKCSYLSVLTLTAMAAMLLPCFPQSDVPARGRKALAGKSRTIPLSAIYTTTSQEELKPVQKHLDEPYRRTLGEINGFCRTGASNVFLVRANGLNHAIEATYGVLVGRRSAETPAAPDNGLKHQQLWVVVYLGITGSCPPKWLIRSVDTDGDRVRVNFADADVEVWNRKDGSKPIRSKDNLHYFYWVPLAIHDKGVRVIELFEVDKKGVVLTRRVRSTAD